MYCTYKRTKSHIISRKLDNYSCPIMKCVTLRSSPLACHCMKCNRIKNETIHVHCTITVQQLLTLKVTSCRPEVTSSAILDDFDGHQDGRGGGDANSSQERVERQGLMLGMTVGGKEEGGGGNPSGKPSKWNQCTFQCALCLKTSNRCCHRKQHYYSFSHMYISISLISSTIFFSRASIVTHIVEEHGLTFREYRAKHPDLEIHSQWLLCRLCNMQVKFTKESISGHLKLTHGTDLATYEQCYMQEEDWPGQSAETGHR